jgi:iron-sulfur cluster repair protein YtfE (RIC family)
MTEPSKLEIDALDLLMQDHREIESLFSDFEHQRQNGSDTSLVIAAACAEIKSHDTLENDAFYPAIAELTKDTEVDRLLSTAEEDHDGMLELIDQLERITVHKKRDMRFAIVADQMKKHIITEETVLFPLVRKLPKADLDRIAELMKTRQAVLLVARGISPTESVSP